ncbi:hypothetical protein BDL97_08G109400 [Sphagnum fallax]|jgi:coiled-coil domain-containing protein 12|nr:hypothetical protein BDL97_08G109400 [Sphagnum fallax]KAH8954968.1 hypothetical protein BDL97_08G109400 [Sphagnum fallax]
MVQAESDPIAERRERLRALRAAAELASADQGDEEAEKQPLDTTPKEQQKEDPEEEGREMKFRNYFPRDQQLQQNKHPPPMVPKFEDPVAKAPLETNGAEDPIVSIAPKKPNSDLRRDVAKKLEKLERRTQRAIIELMQEEERLRQAAAAEEYME